jgi:hypothetical protein
MLKKIAGISSLALMGALAAGLPASASEEDAAAPAGSFTSDMAAPASHSHFAMRHDGAFRFNRHHWRMQSRNMGWNPRSIVE